MQVDADPATVASSSASDQFFTVNEEQEQTKDGILNFILIETPLVRLLEVAEKIKLKLPIAENNLEKDGDFQTLWNRIECLNPPEIKRDKYRRLFTAAYSSSLRKEFEKYFDKDESQVITAKDRCLITYEILSRTTFSKKISQPAIFASNENDPNIGIDLLVANETFLAAYPLHENYEDTDSAKSDRKLLWEYWARPRNFYIFQPLHIIRQYFGEKLAFYFSWLGFYTTWLILPSIVGLLVFIYGCITVSFDIPTNEICSKSGIGNTSMCPLCDNPNCKVWKLHESCLYSRITYLVDNPATVVFSVCMAVWTVLFIEFWKREQSKLQFEWDTTDFQKKLEPIRPEFELKVQKKRVNPITGEVEPFVSLKKRAKRFVFSGAVVLFMICLVLALVFGVIVYRVVIMIVLSKSEKTRMYSGTITSITAAIINLIIIILLSRVYAWLAVKLTDLEYHRTDSKYEDSLTIKMYLFQFVNFYASIFYIAFFKGRIRDKHGFVEECDQSGCLIELCIQLAIIMVGKQILNNIQEVLYPILQNYWNRGLRNNSKSKVPLWKQDLNLMSWNSLTLFDEYLEMVIQFGFITLFVVAFPIGPLFAFLNNIIEIRIDAFKVLTQFRRPLPKRAQDIGIWLPILNIISKLGVITNGAIIAFTSEFIPRLVYQYGSGNGTLVGYVSHTLSSKNVSDLENPPSDSSLQLCWYRDYRESHNSPNKYGFTLIHYEVLAARLLFLVCFEHVVFFILTLMHCIPDIPQDIQDQIERENIITQKVIWQTKHLSPFELTKAKASSTVFINTMNSFSDHKNFEDMIDKTHIFPDENSKENDNLLNLRTNLANGL